MGKKIQELSLNVCVRWVAEKYYVSWRMKPGVIWEMDLSDDNLTER